jgi:hypothetical protein
MAELIGLLASGITLAGLFKTCLDAIDLIQTAQQQELDLKKLVLKLNIEKCRLYAWGEAMGLTTPSSAGYSRPLDSCPNHIRDLVKDTLGMTLQLFTDSHKLKYRYGCREISSIATSGLPIYPSDFGPIESLAASFSQFRVGTRSSEKVTQLKLKTRWVIHDRKKFVDLITEAREFIDSLQNITEPLHTAAQQENTIKRGVQYINNVETLNLVAEVCEVDHPAIFNAASEKSTVLSLTSLRQRDIEQWSSDVVAGPEAEVAELESLTVTELKHRVLAHVNRPLPEDVARSNENLASLDTQIMVDFANESQRDAKMIRLISFIMTVYLPATLFSVSSLDTSG